MKPSLKRQRARGIRIVDVDAPQPAPYQPTDAVSQKGSLSPQPNCRFRTSTILASARNGPIADADCSQGGGGGVLLPDDEREGGRERRKEETLLGHVCARISPEDEEPPFGCDDVSV